jgi:putative pyruvate formate lyase activating enzyme
MTTMYNITYKCNLCPRKCNVDRTDNKIGFCGETGTVRVARASLHMWEEPCISGKEGSGTVFFTGCNLKCVFCQNRTIALGHALQGSALKNKARELTQEQLSKLFLLLQSKNANNINLVTPSHFVPQIAKALKMAKSEGLTIPIVYNTSSYELPETLELLEGLVDIYLPDLKYFDSDLSDRYSHAPDYFNFASKAIEEMYRQVGTPIFDDKTGLMKKGVIIRHMIMPSHTLDSKRLIRYMYETYGDNVYISIMNQYTPPTGLKGYDEIKRKVTKREYEKVIDYALSLGIENAFIQEGGTASESFIPDFDDDVFLNEVL